MFTRPASPRRSRSLLSAGVAALLLGLLIWAKLRLVAGIPRTVLAEPPSRASPHAVQAAPNR